MGVISLEYVISYSSQDCIYKAENLLHNPGSEKPWLCSPYDKSGHLEAEFLLNKVSFIDFIDIGNCGSSTVEVQVGRSSFKSSTNYISLLPAVTLLSLPDIKEGVDHSAVYMFNKSNMIKSVAEEKWDRIKVICRQPYRKRCQFGLSFLSLRTKQTISHLSINDQPVFTQKNERVVKEALAQRFNLESKSSNKNSSKAVKRPFSKYLTERSEGSVKPSPFLADFILSRGKQLLKECKARSSAADRKKMNDFEQDVQIFLIACSGENMENKSYEDYMNEFEEQRQQKLNSSEKLVFSNMYLEIFHAHNLSSEQKESSISQSEISFRDSTVSLPSVSKPLDFTAESNSSSLPSGNENEKPSTNSSSGELPNFDIAIASQSKRKCNLATGVGGSKKRLKFSDEHPTLSKVGFNRPEDFIQADGIQPSTSSGITLVDCPICGETFHPSEIERHAATCGELNEPSEYSTNGHSRRPGMPEVIHLGHSNRWNLAKCPLCGELYPESAMSSHVDDCMEND